MRPDENTIYTVETAAERQRQRHLIAQHAVIDKKKLKHGFWEYTYADGSTDMVSMSEHKAVEKERMAESDAIYEGTLVENFKLTLDEETLKNLPPHNQHQPVLFEREYWPNEDEMEHLRLACLLMDRLLLKEEERGVVVDALNSVMVSRWGGLPLFETYEDPSSLHGWSLGYRSNALEAFIIPSDISGGCSGQWVPEDEEPATDEELEDTRWNSRFGPKEMDLLLRMLSSSENESLDDWGWFPEGCMSLNVAYVRNGKVYNKEDWDQLGSALANPNGYASLPRVVPLATTPIVVTKSYGTMASCTVAGYMKNALLSHTYMDWPEGSDHEEMLQDMAVLASKEPDEMTHSPETARQLRREQGITVIQDCWLALNEALQKGQALLPSWGREGPEDHIRVSHHGELFIQMTAYYRANGERLGLAPVQRYSYDSVPALGPVPGQHIRQLVASRLPGAYEHMEDDEDGILLPMPEGWWNAADEATYQSAIGKWVAVNDYSQPMFEKEQEHSGAPKGPVKAYANPEDAPQDEKRFALVFVPGEGKDGEVILNPGYKKPRR